MFSQKSVLARLLANENISVQQGNFKTAFFDVENRVLGLPLWKEMSTDLYDLLVGHEVGHALFTPQGDELKIKGIPFAYVNVIEDIRIEKKILNKYPGLVNNFKRGYSELVEMDLFGTKDKDINEMGFMDRLNIKAKGRDLVDIEFSEEEQPFVDMAMNVETFKDVENVCRELVSWLGSKQDEQDESDEDPSIEDLMNNLKQLDQEGEGDSDESNEESFEEESNDDSEDEIEPSSGASEEEEEDKDQSEEDTGSSPSSEEKEDGEGDINKSAAGKGADDVPENLPEVETENAQSEKMDTLVDTSRMFLQGMSRQAFDLLKNDYKTVITSRVNHAIRLDDLGYTFEEPEVSYDTFMAETKQVVNLMAKEFEMRKAAFRSARARTSTKGSLDVNKLHAYKYDDQLFKQVTTLADGKNHGMIMLVDYSGSMYQRMPAVMRQTIALVMFCKRVNIPFEVYGFTTRRGDTPEFREKLKAASSNLTRFDCDELQLNQLFSNKMSKSDFDLGMRTFYSQISRLRYLPAMEDFGSTPLNAALLASQYLIQDFMKSNPVHKMNLVTLTDGESDQVYSKQGIDTEWGSREYTMNIRGKRVDISMGWGAGRTNTAKLLNAATGPNVTTANFFICDRRDFKHELYTILPYKHAAQQVVRKVMTKNGVWVVESESGYDRRFIMIDKSSSMSGETEELEIESTATPAQIARAFKKHSGSKKGNRVVTKKFAELVA
jgi:hypothetical protein